MVRHAKKLVEDKKLGNIEYINVEYVLDWSLTVDNRSFPGFCKKNI